jgi:hypothetical protein
VDESLKIARRTMALLDEERSKLPLSGLDAGANGANGEDEAEPPENWT